jgi:hypothetical protein
MTVTQERPVGQYERQREHDTARQAELRNRYVRGEVARRMRLFNLNHADNAWQLRHSFGIAPTAVALLYVDPVAPHVRVAGRLLADGPQVADPTRVLYDLTLVARDVLAAGGDPRSEMSEIPERMSPDAYYCGVAVSMLDTPEGSWQAVRRQASSASSVPGRCLMLLTDATMMLADRREPHRVDHYTVRTSQLLDPASGPMGEDNWLLTPGLGEFSAGDPLRPVWIRLYDLHAALAGGAPYGR